MFIYKQTFDNGPLRIETVFGLVAACIITLVPSIILLIGVLAVTPA